MKDYMIQLADKLAERLQCDRYLALDFIMDVFMCDLDIEIALTSSILNGDDNSDSNSEKIA